MRKKHTGEKYTVLEFFEDELFFVGDFSDICPCVSAYLCVRASVRRLALH